MHAPLLFRFYRVPFVDSIALFFCFIGHLCVSAKDVLLRRLSISWFDLLHTVYRSGATLTIPLVLIGSLLGASLVLNIYEILSPFNLQHNVLLIAQHILFYDLLPFIVSFILLMQSALNLINAQIRELQRTPQDVVLMHVIPIMIGINLSAILLYIYSLSAVFISIYFSFRYLLKTNIYEYLFHLTNTITSKGLIYSIFKTTLYCTLVSLIVGYYYYQVATGHLSLRKAMSRIMTRGFVWLVISSVYFKFLYY